MKEQVFKSEHKKGTDKYLYFSAQQKNTFAKKCFHAYSKTQSVNKVANPSEIFLTEFHGVNRKLLWLVLLVCLKEFVWYQSLESDGSTHRIWSMSEDINRTLTP